MLMEFYPSLLVVYFAASARTHSCQCCSILVASDFVEDRSSSPTTLATPRARDRQMCLRIVSRGTPPNPPAHVENKINGGGRFSAQTQKPKHLSVAKEVTST